MNSEITYRMENSGVLSLSDSETLSVAMGSKPEKVRALLAQFNDNLRSIAKLTMTELVAAGLTKREAKSLIAILEIGRRKQLQDAEEQPKIMCSKDIFNLFQPIVADLAHEEFWIAYMSRSNKVLARKRMSQGGINGTVTDIRMILKEAILLKASAIIACHNHPSGNINPSESDTRVTQKLKEAGNIMDIQLLDHIVISDKDYYSFADNGLL